MQGTEPDHHAGREKAIAGRNRTGSPGWKASCTHHRGEIFLFPAEQQQGTKTGMQVIRFYKHLDTGVPLSPDRGIEAARELIY